jgi:hypothetical protein
MSRKSSRPFWEWIRMGTSHRTLAAAGAIALAALLGLAPGAAQAQTPGTYEEAPFQQGSMMYRPSGRPRPPKAVAPRPFTAPANNVPQSGYTYRQQGGYTYYYYTPQSGYTTAPAPAGTYYVQPRRGLFGLFR